MRIWNQFTWKCFCDRINGPIWTAAHRPKFPKSKSVLLNWCASISTTLSWLNGVQVCVRFNDLILHWNFVEFAWILNEQHYRTIARVVRSHSRSNSLILRSVRVLLLCDLPLDIILLSSSSGFTLSVSVEIEWWCFYIYNVWKMGSAYACGCDDVHCLVKQLQREKRENERERKKSKHALKVIFR